jgi:hypothetical protein
MHGGELQLACCSCLQLPLLPQLLLLGMFVLRLPLLMPMLVLQLLPHVLFQLPLLPHVFLGHSMPLFPHVLLGHSMLWQLLLPHVFLGHTVLLLQLLLHFAILPQLLVQVLMDDFGRPQYVLLPLPQLLLLLQICPPPPFLNCPIPGCGWRQLLFGFRRQARRVRQWVGRARCRQWVGRARWR